MPKLSEIIFGKKDKIKKAGTISPEQQELINLIKEGLTSGEGAFGDIFGSFDKEAFDKGVTQPQLKDFKENVLPMLQESFINNNQVGGSGQLRYQNKAAVDLQSRLASLMYGAQQNQNQNRLTGIQTSLNTKPFENLYKQGSEGLAVGALKGVTQGIGKGAGMAIAG